MYKLKVNNGNEYTVVPEKDGKGTINGKDYCIDKTSLGEGGFHAIINNRSYTLQFVKTEIKEKQFTVLVNNKKYNITAKDRFDELLSSMGMDAMSAKKVKMVKAPMPGLVLDVRVQENSEVKAGDPLLVLEAMKMENIIKSPADGVVSKIEVKKGTAVEKNQVLIHFA